MESKKEIILHKYTYTARKARKNLFLIIGAPKATNVENWVYPF